MKAQFKRGTALVGIESQEYDDLKLKEYQDALKIVKNYIHNDPEIKLGYVANIAMPFLDCEYHYRKKNNKKYLNRKDKHIIANEAAINFMNIWMG